MPAIEVVALVPDAPNQLMNALTQEGVEHGIEGTALLIPLQPHSGNSWTGNVPERSQANRPPVSPQLYLLPPAVGDDYDYTCELRTHEYGPKHQRTQIVAGGSGEALVPHSYEYDDNGERCLRVTFAGPQLITLARYQRDGQTHLTMTVSYLLDLPGAVRLVRAGLATGPEWQVCEKVELTDPMRIWEAPLQALRDRARCPGCDRSHYAAGTP